MTQKNIEKIKRKIAGLLAKAGGTDNVHEAEAFAAKAAAMLEEHQLEIGDVVKNDPIERTVISTIPVTPKIWQQILPAAISTYYGCFALQAKIPGATVVVAVGRESARVVTALMFPYLLGELRKHAATLRKETLYSTGKCMQLMVDNFVRRLQELAEQRKAVGVVSNGRALVQISDALAWVQENVGGITQGKAIPLEHHARARELADSVSLGDQVKDQTDGEPLLLAHG